MQTEEFADFLFELLSKLKTHDWTNKQQQDALRKRKEDLQEGEVILAGDFSENYSSLIQVRIHIYTYTLGRFTKPDFGISQNALTFYVSNINTNNCYKRSFAQISLLLIVLDMAFLYSKIQGEIIQKPIVSNNF